jgi:hypothetical protein
MIKRIAFAAGLLLATTTSLQAQAPLLDVRIGAQTAAPTGSLDNGFDYGYGLYARAGAPFGPVKLMGALTWTRFKHESPAFNDLDLITVQFGPHLMLVPGVELGLEGAYISEVEKLGFSPSFAIGIPNFEVVLSYTTTLSGPTTSWLALGVGLKF